MIVVQKFFAAIMWLVVFALALVVSLLVLGTFLPDRSAPGATNTFVRGLIDNYALIAGVVILLLAFVGSAFGLLPGAHHAPRPHGASQVVAMVFRKIGGATIYTTILYLLITIGGLTIAGYNAAPADGANAYEAGEAAAVAFSEAYEAYIVSAAVLIGTLGSLLGWLPFTRQTKH